MRTRTRGTDADLVRAAARRIAWQFSIASALIVVIVAGLVLASDRFCTATVPGTLRWNRLPGRRFRRRMVATMTTRCCATR